MHRSRAGSQGPRPSPGTPTAARRGPAPPAFPRRCRPHPAAARWGHPDPGLGRTRAPTPPALPAARPPASAPLSRLRLAGFVRRGRGASTEAPRPGFKALRRARRLDPRASVGGSDPPATHLRRVRTEGPALSRLKPLGPPHTPQCPRCLLVLDGPPIARLLVHLKGLWARAACGFKGAARSRASSDPELPAPLGIGSLEQKLPTTLPAPSPRKEGRKMCRAVHPWPPACFLYLILAIQATVNTWQNFLKTHFIHQILIVQLSA